MEKQKFPSTEEIEFGTVLIRAFGIESIPRHIRFFPELCEYIRDHLDQCKNSPPSKAFKEAIDGERKRILTELMGIFGKAECCQVDTLWYDKTTTLYDAITMPIQKRMNDGSAERY